MKQRVVRASNLNFTVLEMGEGPLVLCLHGFPDTAHSFRYQMPALAAAGYHCVAPFMRGYSPTEAAPDGRYDSPVLSEDALALITALGYKDAIVFGHDWGAVAAYGAAAAAPDRVSKLVTVAVGYGSKFFEALVTSPAQQRRSWYMFFFQTKLAETAVSFNDFAFLEKLGPTGRQVEMGARRHGSAQAIVPRPGHARSSNRLLPRHAGTGLQRAGRSKRTRRHGLNIPINVPGLMIHGRDDGCIGSETLDGMEKLFPKGLKIELVPGTGHFAASGTS